MPAGNDSPLGSPAWPLVLKPGFIPDAEPDPQSHLGRRQAPIVPTPELRPDHDSVKAPRQFSKSESHFTTQRTSAFQKGSPGGRHLADALHLAGPESAVHHMSIPPLTPHTCPVM